MITEYARMRFAAMKRWHDAGVPTAEIRRRLAEKDAQNAARLRNAKRHPG